jgi:hypothetical protein
MAALPQNRALSGASLAAAALGVALFLATAASANRQPPAAGQPALAVADDEAAPGLSWQPPAPGLAARTALVVDPSASGNVAVDLCRGGGWNPIPVGHCKIPPANDDSSPA